MGVGVTTLYVRVLSIFGPESGFAISVTVPNSVGVIVKLMLVVSFSRSKLLRSSIPPPEILTWNLPFELRSNVSVNGSEGVFIGP